MSDYIFISDEKMKNFL